MKVSVLTEGFASPNGSAFLYPLIRYRSHLRDAGFNVQIVKDVKDVVGGTEVLLLDSKYHRLRWAGDSERVLEEIERLRASVDRFIFCDNGDSSGMILSTVMPYVDAYAKGQLLRDRERYLEPMYGGRLFTDYYSRVFGVEDPSPLVSDPLKHSDLRKLRLHWNSGLADYGRWGPAKAGLYARFPLATLTRFNFHCTDPSSKRDLVISGRMNLNYSRPTVSAQRRLLAEVVGDRLETTKLPRGAYLDEMRRSKIVLSGFGWGEIAMKDFEVLLCGAALLKPDMSHHETWPELYLPWETFAPVQWDLQDLGQVIEKLADEDDLRMRIATQGQERYRDAVGPNGAEAFVAHFAAVCQ